MKKKQKTENKKKKIGEGTFFWGRPARPEHFYIDLGSMVILDSGHGSGYILRLDSAGSGTFLL